MKDVLPVLQEALDRLRARQMVVEIAVMEFVRALLPHERRRFAERFSVQVATVIQQQADRLSPAAEDQIASMLRALQQAASDPAP